MDTNSLLPPRARQLCYMIFALLGLAQGSAYVALSSLGRPFPDYLKAASAVYGFLATAPFVVALLNLNKDEVSFSFPAAVDEPDLADDLDQDTDESDVDEAEVVMTGMQNDD
ncbi:MAG TPA: hypothetical protein VIP98_14895 [Microlunatus sp.]